MNLKSLSQKFEQLLDHTPEITASASGQLIRVVGLTLEARGCTASLGSLCSVESDDGDIIAEVIGFDDQIIYLMAIDEVKHLIPGARVTPLKQKQDLQLGIGLLGRILDGNGQPIDGKGALHFDEYAPRDAKPINPLARQKIDQPLDVGVRSINTMLTIGKGQRMGLFAKSGVGKSVLMGMMTRGTEADVVVVGLVGERGREVKEFIEESLGEQGLTRAVVVTSPADTSPLMRLRACETATRIAEYFRDKKKDVLLLMDSLTRYSQAQREVALAVGEPPATKGYPPSVFARLPKLVERAGQGDEDKGSITAFYTVLIEGEEIQDPIADAARAILDGHIYLSRELAESGHYPAIDMETSISRLAPAVTSEETQQQVRDVRECNSLYQRHRDLISIGAYVQGSNPKVDQAIRLHSRVYGFFQQKMNVVIDYQQSMEALANIASQCKKGNKA